MPGSGDKEVRRLLEDLPEHFRERVIEALDSYHADNERTAIDLISPFILLVKEAIHAGNTKSIRPPVLSNLDQLNEERRIERETEWNEWRKEAEGIRKESTQKLSKSELARRVKRRLNLKDSERTIRNRL